jgi:hypothetical protein
MAQKYLLEWFDEIITKTFNPANPMGRTITIAQAKAMTEQVYSEVAEIQTNLKDQVFTITKEKQIKLFVSKYHTSLVHLLDTFIGNSAHAVKDSPHLAHLVTLILSSMDELLTFIETRFQGYLALEEYVPANYLVVARKQLSQKLEDVKVILAGDMAAKPVSDIVFGNLAAFLNSGRHKQITFREVLYRKELVRELEQMTVTHRGQGYNVLLHELLVYMNFNSTAFINHYTVKIYEELENIALVSERMERLIQLSKGFSKLYSNKNVTLYPRSENLKTVLNRWFLVQIDALQHTSNENVIPLGKGPFAVPQITGNTTKLTCILSSDQIGLILRGADELQVVKARSMSAVFRAIVPHLSTPNKDNLSYDAMRSKSYNAEEKDKEAAIAVLENIIRKIRGY